MVIPTLLGVTIITFTLTYLLPGNPAMVKAGPFATPEYLALMEKEIGLDKPIYIQYWRYLSGVVRGDLGQSSSTGRPVLEDFKQRVPATLELTLASLLIAVGIGIPLAVISAVRRDSLLDHICRLLGVGGVAMPTFWTGLLLLYIFFYHVGLAPPPLGRLGSGISAPTGITGGRGKWPPTATDCIRGCPSKYADPCHHSHRCYFWLFNGWQCHCGTCLWMARDRKLCRDLPHVKGRATDTEFCPVRFSRLRYDQSNCRHCLRGSGSPNQAPLKTGERVF
jgi:hypothetical protein